MSLILSRKFRENYLIRDDVCCTVEQIVWEGSVVVLYDGALELMSFWIDIFRYQIGRHGMFIRGHP